MTAQREAGGRDGERDLSTWGWGQPPLIHLPLKRGHMPLPLVRREPHHPGVCPFFHHVWSDCCRLPSGLTGEWVQLPGNPCARVRRNPRLPCCSPRCLGLQSQGLSQPRAPKAGLAWSPPCCASRLFGSSGVKVMTADPSEVACLDDGSPPWALALTKLTVRLEAYI